MSLGKGRTQQTVEAFKELLCGVSSQTGDIFGNMRTAKAWQTKKALVLQTGWNETRMSLTLCNTRHTNLHLHKALQKNIP